MKTQQTRIFGALALLVLSTLNSQLSTTFAQGTAFTYQGRLNSSNSPASGTYNFAFSLFTVPAGGYPIGSQVIANGVAVTNGLFMVTLDFGASAWNGETNWLAIDVETNGAGTFTFLSPRQQLTPTPYAIYSEMASNLTGTLPVSQVSGIMPLTQLPASVVTNMENGVTLGGTFGGNGGGLTNLNASKLASGVVPNAVLPNFQPPGYNTIGGGYSNSVSGPYSTVGGGNTNNATGIGATVAGGYINSAKSDCSTVGGGCQITASGFSSTVAGGYKNTASGSGAFVGGGGFDGISSIGNLASGTASVVGGGTANQATNFYATVGGGNGNTADGAGAFIGGGGFDGTNYWGNIASGSASVVAGGYGNQAPGTEATVGGGANNYAGPYATVSGGAGNNASGPGAFIGGGGYAGAGFSGNDATGSASVVAGGMVNQAQATYATIGGGYDNVAGGTAATIPGGYNNTASGQYSFAAGQQAQALHQGAFVWADSQNAVFASTANDQFLIRAQGGVGIGTTSPGQPLDVLNAQASARFTTTVSGNGSVIELKNTAAGTTTLGAINFNNAANGYPGQIAYSSGNTMSFRVAGNSSMMVLTSSGLTVNGTFVSSSDRNLKQNFQPVDSRNVLEKVSQLPVQTWAYKNDPGTKHLGPMAQDFYAAFGTGADDKHIAVVDEGGVALAAIQGLNAKLNEKDGKINELENRLNQLEQNLQSLTNKK